MLSPSSPKVTATISCVALGTLISSLSGSMINLALPELGRELNADLSSLRWVVQVFLVTIGASLLPAGRLGDLVGLRRVYLLGFGLFSVASVGCGLSPDLGWLLGLRGLCGVFGSLVMAVGPAILTTAVPSTHRGRALGVMSTATYIGLTIGPPLGGAIIAWLDWRWIFHWSALVGAGVTAVSAWMLPRVDRPRSGSFDWLGATTLGAALAALVVASSFIGKVLTAPGMLGGLGLLTLLGFGAFVWQERRSASPLFDLGLLRSRQLRMALLAAVCNYVALFVLIPLLPFYVEAGLGRSTAVAGAFMTVQPLVMAMVAAPSGWLSDRIGPRELGFSGMALLSVGLLALSFVDRDSTDLIIAGGLAVVGLGTGLFISPNSSALMGSVPREHQGIAGSLMAEARILGMALGVALGTAVFAMFGGETLRSWKECDFLAFSSALRFAALTALVGAFASLARSAAPARDPQKR
jgi:EmrB/QacA subfamily drug resistance transporter